MGQGQFSEGKAAWHSSHPYGQTLPSSKAGWHRACWKTSLLSPQAHPDIVWERGGWSGPSPCLGSWRGFNARDDPRGGFSLLPLPCLVCLVWSWGALGFHTQIVPARTQHLGKQCRTLKCGIVDDSAPESKPGVKFAGTDRPSPPGYILPLPTSLPIFPRKNQLNRHSCVLQGAEGESATCGHGLLPP